MRKLILIKHARPLVEESIPAREWGLSDEGTKSCAPLAEVLKALEPATIVTSDELKAIQTGDCVAADLGLSPRVFPGLHEHDRSNVPMMPSREFLSMLALFFQQPERLVLGRETAAQAGGRFAHAIDAVLKEYPSGNIAVITHGTILALFASAHGAGDGFSLYRRLGLPSLIVFSSPDFRPSQTIEKISP